MSFLGSFQSILGYFKGKNENFFKVKSLFLIQKQRKVKIL